MTKQTNLSPSDIALSILNTSYRLMKLDESYGFTGRFAVSFQIHDSAQSLFAVTRSCSPEEIRRKGHTGLRYYGDLEFDISEVLKGAMLDLDYMSDGPIMTEPDHQSLERELKDSQKLLHQGILESLEEYQSDYRLDAELDVIEALDELEELLSVYLVDDPNDKLKLAS